MDSIAVRLGSPAKPISPDLWGIFIEDLNHAVDGGLYAELVLNPSFDYATLNGGADERTTGWTAIGGSDSSILLTDKAPRRAGHSYAVIGSVAVAGAGITNAGLGGMSMSAGEGYVLRLTARADSAPSGCLVVAMEDGQGPVTEPQELGVGESWDSTTMVLRALRSTTSGRLTIRVRSRELVAVERVSLLPQAGFGQANLPLRRDLAQAIADLQPRFVRFPGGCLVHGLGLDNMYRWKDTLGPIEDRRRMPNLWGYHQTMGMGYFEYFQLCAEIGAKPLPVVAAGVCCQNTIGGPVGLSGEELHDYVNEVLDLVEFANGPVTSTWGALRHALGREEPFGLQYLGIGNEDEQTPLFRSNFRRLAKAVNAAYPDIVLVGTAGPFPAGRDFEQGRAFSRAEHVPLVDEHAYRSPRWFFRNADRFDGYDRSGPAVLMGEYASRSNTMRSALAEAAFMLGMERNGDIVRLASYAPLLAKVDASQWQPDLIYFDDNQVMKTLNYHVQQMHSLAAGDELLSVESSVVREVPRQPLAEIAVRVSTQAASAELWNLTADGLAPLADGVVLVEPGIGSVVARGPATGRYRIRMKLRRTAGDGNLVIAFGEVDGSRFSTWDIGAWTGHQLQLSAVDDGITSELGDGEPVTLETGRVYDVDISVDGARIVCRLDGELIHDVVEDLLPEQRFVAGAVRERSTGRVHLKVVNATEAPVQVRVDLVGGPERFELTGLELSAELEQGLPFLPSPVAPRRLEPRSVEGSTVLELARCSFTTVTLTPAG